MAAPSGPRSSRFGQGGQVGHVGRVTVVAPGCAVLAHGLAGVLRSSGWDVTVRERVDGTDAWVVAVLDDADGAVLLPDALDGHVPVVGLGSHVSAVRLARMARRGTVAVDRGAPFEVVAGVTQGALAGTPPNGGAPRRDAESLAARADEARRLTLLTPAEASTLSLLVGGLTASEIATTAHVSLHTVRSHVKAVLAKLGVRSQLAAVALARRCFWAVPDGDVLPGYPQSWGGRS